MRRTGFFAVALAAAFCGPVHAQRGDAPNAKFLAPEEERILFHVPPGFEVQLVAAEPEIQKPLNLNFDAAGRLWVSGTELYPWPAKTDALGRPIASFQKNWDANALAFRAVSKAPPPPEDGRDTVRVLADFGADGRARKSTVFADKLNIPIGLQPLPRRPGAKGDTVIVFSIPSIWRLEDTDGDGVADTREQLYSEFGFKDTHGMSSNYVYWLDGWIYGTHGFANRSEIRDRSGRLTVLESGNTYRFRPDGSRFELWVHGQTNPFGLAFDPRGDLYSADSHSKPVYLLLPGGYYEGINNKHDGLGFAPAITRDDHGSSAIAGIAYYAATQFPEEFRGNLFNGNPVTRRINRDRLEWQGSTPQAVRQPDFLTCDDPAFRPVQVKLGPDGALWIADFYNPIIGHYEVPLTHPNRDHGHGRIWRIVWRGLENEVPSPALPDLAAATAPGLVGRLSDPNLAVRMLAVNELVERADPAAVVSALRQVLRESLSGADRTATLAAAFALERLQVEASELFSPAPNPGDEDATLVALRILAGRSQLDAAAETLISDIVERAVPGMLWRAAAGIFIHHPDGWQAPLILTMLGQAPALDKELGYALRLALKTQMAVASLDDLTRWAERDDTAEARLAEVSLAVHTPAAAEFLLGHLERTGFAGKMSGEYARHAVLELPPERFSVVESLVRQSMATPLAEQLTLAEGVAAVALKPGRALSAETAGWLKGVLLAALDSPDSALVGRALTAVKDLPLPEKSAPLRRIALEAKAKSALRIAAMKALPPDGNTDVFAQALTGGPDLALRKAAVELLGGPAADAVARAALGAALPTAQSDFALLLSTALAKSEAGAADVLTLVAAGKVPATLLRHRDVAAAFARWPVALRERAAGLTRDLPPEDARIDAIIAQRAAAFNAAKTDATRGAAVFAENCAACHRFREVGGSIGPSLDGISSRGAPRLIEDILDPSRNVDPSFRLNTLTTADGSSYGGVNLREDGETYLLSDATGKDIVLRKAEVRIITPLGSSLMPAVFESALPEPDFFDLLGYLLRSGD